MEKEKMIDEIAIAKAKKFQQEPTETSGILDFLKNGFSGLIELEVDELRKIHDDLYPKPNTAKTSGINDEETVGETTLHPELFAGIVPEKSVLLKRGYEIVAQNIMVVLSRTGNRFRDLPWEEYVSERKKDKGFSDGEKEYFNAVIGYCKNADSALLFSPEWAALKRK